MKRRSTLRFFLLPSLSFALVTALAGTAAAQGTMTPAGAQPPPLPPAEPTPTQPPVVQQATPAPVTEPPAEETKADRQAPPKEHTGFQLSLRTGVAVPLGEVDKGDSISDTFTPQVPIIADIGVKVIPQLFLGGYVGISAGGVGDVIKKACDRVGVDCLAVGFRIGIEGQLHIAPDARWNPWVGYGIGYEIAGASGSKAGNKLSAALGGVEFAHFMGGVDYRISRVVGIGPYADFALGQYSIASLEATSGGSTTKTDGDIKDKSLHEWLLIGVKITFFP
jgi:hypothetical protein